MTEEKCQRCGDDEDDLRTLWHACLYAMNEMDLPFKEQLLMLHVDASNITNNFYTLRVCKKCRSDWMIAIKNWFENPIPQEEKGTGIYIREFGAVKEVTQEEFYLRQAKKSKNDALDREYYASALGSLKEDI